MKVTCAIGDAFRVCHVGVETCPGKVAFRADRGALNLAKLGIRSHVSNIGRTNRED